jgi:hypothetical protein
MQWEQKASEKLEELVLVVRDPFRTIIKSSAQTHAEKYAEVRKSPHVTVKEAVLGFLRARSHKLSTEGVMFLRDYELSEEDFLKYPKGQNQI